MKEPILLIPSLNFLLSITDALQCMVVMSLSCKLSFKNENNKSFLQNKQKFTKKRQNFLKNKNSQYSCKIYYLELKFGGIEINQVIYHPIGNHNKIIRENKIIKYNLI